MRIVVVSAVAVAALMLVSNAFAQPTCLRPKWTECESFPNGGRHTGIDPQGGQVQSDIPAGSEICVINESEIGAEHYAQFSRNGVAWPNRDWEVKAETFCLYRN
jgi:hypothetical protein